MKNFKEKCEEILARFKVLNLKSKNNLSMRKKNCDFEKKIRKSALFRTEFENIYSKFKK
jgi:hypothetical protein